MKKLHVITLPTNSTKEEFQLPSTIGTITGVTVSAFCKGNNAKQQRDELLHFPASAIDAIAYHQDLDSLMYMMIMTRASKADSIAKFDEIVTPVIVNLINKCLQYDIDGSTITDDLVQLFQNGFATYLYEDNLYDDFTNHTTVSFKELISLKITQFALKNRESIFKHTVEYYDNLSQENVGVVSLLLNDNNFLLRDYFLTSNRKFKKFSDEMLPVNEELQKNNNLTVVFKQTNQQDTELRIYIQYIKNKNEE